MLTLTRKSAKLVKDIAYWIDKAAMYDSCIRYNREDFCFDMAREQVLRRAAIKKVGRYAVELQHYYNMSNKKFDMLIFKMICTQFVNNNYFCMGAEDFDEKMDGSLHPEFNGNWIDTLDGYQLNFMPTRDMVGMKF